MQYFCELASIFVGWWCIGESVSVSHSHLQYNDLKLAYNDLTVT